MRAVMSAMQLLHSVARALNQRDTRSERVAKADHELPGHQSPQDLSPHLVPTFSAPPQTAGLAACETACNWDVLVGEARDLAVIGGIDAPVLSEAGDDSRTRLEWTGRMNVLAQNRRLTVCSSTGIASAAQLGRLETLYRWLDEVS